MEISFTSEANIFPDFYPFGPHVPDYAAIGCMLLALFPLLLLSLLLFYLQSVQCATTPLVSSRSPQEDGPMATDADSHPGTSSSTLLMTSILLGYTFCLIFPLSSPPLLLTLHHAFSHSFLFQKVVVDGPVTQIWGLILVSGNVYRIPDYQYQNGVIPADSNYVQFGCIIRSPSSFSFLLCIFYVYFNSIYFDYTFRHHPIANSSEDLDCKQPHHQRLLPLRLSLLLCQGHF